MDIIMFTKMMRMIMKFEASMSGHCVGGDPRPNRGGHCY